MELAVAERAKKPLTRRGGYEPPVDVHELDSSTVGFTNGFYLRVPRLYTAGNRRYLEDTSVAIVGSRDASQEGQERAAKLAHSLTREGVVVMSGLAAGIDAAAHRSAIEHGGRTIAVIGTPLDKAYPREHAQLQETIYREHLLLSPFAAGTRTFPSHFPERNKVMARLASATVIIEAGDTSGSLHQAVESLAVGHPVFIARAVLKNPRLTWPARFMGQPHVHELEADSDVLDQILR